MWKVPTRYFDGNKFHVTLTMLEPKYHIISGEFDEDISHLTDEQLVQQTLDQFYRENYLGKFINEAVVLAEKKAKEIEALSVKLNQTFENAESQVLKMQERSNLAQDSLTELAEMVYDHETRLTLLEGDGENDEANLEGGE